MDPEALRAILAVLREAGVSEAFIPGTLRVKFGDAPAVIPVRATPFVDEKGAPIDLDEGAGPLERDPFEDPGDRIAEANFRAKP